MKLTLVRFIVLACIGGCQFLPPMLVSPVSSSVPTPEKTVTPAPEDVMSEDLIRDKAQLISLRVYSVNQEEWEKNGLILNESGSGVLMAMEPTPTQPSVYKYLVLTANHVAKKSREKGKESEFYIRTHDGLIHKARRHPQEFDKTDLALLYFYSPYRYQVAGTAKKPLKEKHKVFVTGFPCDLALTNTPCPAEFKLIAGEVQRVLNKPLVDNYSIGYTNEVVEGTSGGPIFNAQGEVVGINGRREDGKRSQYKRADGSESTGDEINEMKTLRWGIPIDFYLKLETRKLFKEILPLNQEFVPIRYISKPEPQTNQPTPTPSTTPKITSEPDSQTSQPTPTSSTTPGNNSPKKSQQWIEEYLVPLKYVDRLHLPPIQIAVLVVGAFVILLLFLFFRNKTKVSPTTKTQGKQGRNGNEDKLIGQLYLPFYNNNYSQATFLFTHQPQENKPFNLFHEEFSKNHYEYQIIKNDKFIIFIKRAIPRVKGKLKPQVTSSRNDYEFTENQDNVWQLKKISQTAPSSIVIEFVEMKPDTQVIQNHL
jgi:Trypsin-like peptidase domain